MHQAHAEMTARKKSTSSTEKWSDKAPPTSVRLDPETMKFMKYLAYKEDKPVADVLRDLVAAGGKIHPRLPAFVAEEGIDPFPPEPTELEGKIAEGRALLESSPVKARAIFAAASALDPSHPDPHYWQGVAAERLNVGGDRRSDASRGLQRQAIDLYRKALELDPDHRPAQLALRLATEQLPMRGSANPDRKRKPKPT